MKTQISQQEAITHFLNKCNNNSKPIILNKMKKQPINTLDNFPVNVEVYRAFEILVFEQEDETKKMDIESPDVDGEIPLTLYSPGGDVTVYLTKEDALNMVKFLVRYV